MPGWNLATLRSSHMLLRLRPALIVAVLTLTGCSPSAPQITSTPIRLTPVATRPAPTPVPAAPAPAVAPPAATATVAPRTAVVNVSADPGKQSAYSARFLVPSNAERWDLQECATPQMKDDAACLFYEPANEYIVRGTLWTDVLNFYRRVLPQSGWIIDAADSDFDARFGSGRVASIYVCKSNREWHYVSVTDAGADTLVGFGTPPDKLPCPPPPAR